MPSSTRHTRTLSPPMTTTSYSNATTAGQQKMNVVTRLAIEGKSKKGWDGASIKVYLKISLPLDSLSPGVTIPLFPEESLKILEAQVHPLDTNSVPYNFSSADAPLLHKAARALNLAARLQTPYMSGSDSMASSSASIPSLDAKYTGCILVSGYHISYVAPKEFPRREYDSRSKRGSQVMHLMAAIDMWVPFLSKPPHAPYLLSIPVPRCLSNQIKLKIFPPGQSTSSSLASLSSADEDGGSWELTSDPHVTRSQSARLSRSHSYNNFADDESSDASTTAGFPEGCGIQGSFPSTDRVRVRWASPAKAGQVPETADGRRRVGIREVKGDITCTVLGASKGKGRDRGDNSLVVKLDYTATCKGVWFPGVATLLGMDLGLEAGDCDVSWAPDNEPKWTVTGGAGFTGYAVAGPPQLIARQPASRQSSEEYPPPVYVLPSSPNGNAVNGHSHMPNRSSSNSSTASGGSASLLRAPLPGQNVADYSFESSPVSTPSGTVSSLPSLSAPSSPERHRKRRSSSRRHGAAATDTEIDEADVGVPPPRAPITIHLNMNELSPPPKNVFVFHISGTVLLSPRPLPLTPDSRRSSPVSSDNESIDDPISLPVFRIFYADQEVTSTIVRNEFSQTSLHVFSGSNQNREANVRKAVLMNGNQFACGIARVRIALSPISPTQLRGRRPSEDSSDVSYNRTGLSLGLRSIPSTSKLRDVSMMSTARLQPRRDGPLMIPFVTATITSLLGDGTAFENGYAVEIALPAPSDADSEWLEFGLALTGQEGSANSGGPGPRNTPSCDGPPQVEIASASVEGVPVRCQTSATVKPQPGLAELGLPFEEMSGKEWISWVSVHVGHIGGGNVKIIYLVKGKGESKGEVKTEKPKGKQREQFVFPLEILLPSFALPVGLLQVDIRVQKGFEISSLRTNFVHEQTSPQGLRLLHYALNEFYYPRLSVRVESIEPAAPKASTWPKTLWTFGKTVSVLVLFAVIFSLASDLRHATSELQTMKQAAAQSTLTDPSPVVLTETVIITTTVPAGDPYKWWFNQGVASSVSLIPTVNVDSPTLEHVSESTSEEPPHPEIAPTSLPTATARTLEASPAQIPSNTPTVIYDTSSLIPVQYFPIRWSWHHLLRVPLTDGQVSESARSAAHAVIGHIGAIWQLFRKVLHYPLDPP